LIEVDGILPPVNERHRPRKRFGQHFLHDEHVLRRIVAEVAPQPDDLMVEIGPGEGALTRPLLGHLSHLQVIEIDRDLAARLVTAFPASRLTVHVSDALEFDFGTLPSGLRVVGNLPYNVSTPLLFHLSAYAPRVKDMHFMLQREVVDRMAAPASTPQYGRLSVMLQRRFRIQPLFRVAPGAFRPPPKVESAVVRLVPIPAEELEKVDEAGFAELVRRAFVARRKTLRNALSGLVSETQMRAIGIDPGLRPENITPQQYIQMSMTTDMQAASSSDVRK